jgi:hypothetical protein
MIEARESEKQEERRDALHTLYMNAGNFITTEDQLQVAIDRAFTMGANPAWYNAASSTKEAESVWNLGPPETVQQMLGKVNKTGNKAIEYNEGYAKVTGERVRRIAEELTGGRL